MEVAVAALFKVNLYLSWFFAAPGKRLQRLLEVLGLQHASLDVQGSVVKVDESSLGKVLSAQEEGTRQSLNMVMARVFTKVAVQGQCLLLKPLPQSEGADMYVSLPFVDGTYALLLVSCKATTNAKGKEVPSVVVAREVDTAAAVVAALPNETRALYGARIFLLFLEHPTQSVSKTTLTVHDGRGFTEVHLDAASTNALLDGGWLTPEQALDAVQALKVKSNGAVLCSAAHVLLSICRWCICPCHCCAWQVEQVPKQE